MKKPNLSCESLFVSKTFWCLKSMEWTFEHAIKLMIVKNRKIRNEMDFLQTRHALFFSDLIIQLGKR